MSDQPFYQTFNSGFWLSITALIFTFLGVAIKACYTSKCKRCSVCFGLFEINRDIAAEQKYDLLQSEESTSIII
jgi:hypothetical protein